MPTSALNTFAKDVLQAEKAKTSDENQDGLLKPFFENKLTDVRELGFDVNELLREMLLKLPEKTIFNRL